MVSERLCGKDHSTSVRENHVSEAQHMILSEMNE